MSISTLFARILIMLSLASVIQSSQGESPYRMEGNIVEAETQEPVAGATVEVLIESEVPETRLRKGVSDAAGHYSVVLPIGHAWAWNVRPPAGYYFTKDNDRVFVTTAADPVFSKDYQVRRGVTFPVAYRLFDAAPPPADTAITFVQWRDGETLIGDCRLDGATQGTVTVPDIGGEFQIYGGDTRREIQAAAALSVQFEKGFNAHSVRPEISEPAKGVVEVRDTEGRKALVRGCEISVDKQKMTIVVPMLGRKKDGLRHHLRGQILDAGDNPLSDATVALAFYGPGGGASGSLFTKTNAEGRFTIDVPSHKADGMLGLVVTCKGFAGVDTSPQVIEFPESGEADVGQIRLSPGASLRVRIVDADGQPCHGAVLEPTSGFAVRKQIARTDANGECLLLNLPEGRLVALARFGKQSGSLNVTLGPGRNDPQVIKLVPRP